MKKTQTNHRRVVYSLSLVALLLVSGVTVASEPAMEGLPALIVLTGELEITDVVEAVEELNGKISHIFPPQVIIGTLSADAEEALLQYSDITVYRGPVDITECEDWSKEAKYAAIAWNNNYMGLSVDAGLVEPPVSPEPPPDDTEIIPDISSYLVHNQYSLPYGAHFLDTSEYLVGSVAVGVLFLESNGTIDEDMETWTEEEEAQVTSEIQNGLNWLIHQERAADITVVYEWHYSIPVGYEPISRVHTDDDLWEQQAMFHLGYKNPHYLVNEYTYANDLRSKYDTDWAFIIFVVDSSEDEDNAFSDGYYAYSFLGGPRMVVTYSNSIWGIANLDSIVAHETCHLFWALDQHCSSEIEQAAVSGYLAGENLNSEWNGESCTVTVPCIMKGEPMLNSQVDVSTRKQVGWYDSDSDGILDVLDTAPDVTVDQEGTSCTGKAVVSPLPNENPLEEGNDISLNTITTVQYKTDDSDWTEAEPADGSFDGPEEAFTVPCDFTSSGEHVITVKAQNNVGNWSDPVSVTVDIEGMPLLQSEISVSPEAVNAGDTVLVTMTVSNTGEADAVEVTPALTACDMVEMVSGPEPESADIPAGDSVTFEWVYKVNSVDERTPVTFSGGAAGHTISGEQVSSENTESNTVEVHVEPVLTSDVSALLYGIIEGNTISLTMEVHNTGEVVLDNVTPSEITVTFEGSASASLLKGPLPQQPLTLEPGDMKTFEWKYAATPGAQGGTAVFTGTVSGEAEGTVITSKEAQATVGIASPAIVTTFIVAAPKEVAVGDTITVAMTVQNIGQAEAIDVVPSELTVSGTGKVELVSGPSRESVNVKGRNFEIVLWTYAAVQEGIVTFSGSAQGIDTSTGDSISVPKEQSNAVTITASDTDTDDTDDTDTDDTDTDDTDDTDTDDTDEPDEPQPPTPPPTPPSEPEQDQQSICPTAARTIQKARDLYKEAQELLEEKTKQNRDVSRCRKLLLEIEMLLTQAELHLEAGNCKQAHSSAISAMMKVYELMNILNNL